MSADNDDIKVKIKAYILEQFLRGEDPDSLEDSTPLITGAILDSIGTVKLVTFLEDTWDISFEPSEMSVDHLNTIDDIAAITKSKLG
jgi:acyl carrier protein